MRRTSALAAAASLCLLLGAAACAGDEGESEEELVDQISKTLQSGGDGFDEKTADCFAEILVDEVGVEAMQDIDVTADDPPEDSQEEIAAATLRAEDECNLGDG